MRVCVTFLHRPLDGRLSRVSRDEKQRGDKTQAKLQEEWKNEEVGRVEEKHGEQTCGEWRATTTMLGRSEPQRLLDDDRFVGTFHHPRPNRPPLRLVPRIVHERFSLAEILQRLLSSWQGQRRGLQFREQVKQGTRTAMLE